SSMASGFSCICGLASAVSGCASAVSDCASAVSSMATRSPCLTRRPTSTFISLIVPPAGDGNSTVALSDSTTSRDCSASTLSPGCTRISMTSTSSAPPKSGTRTSCMLTTVSSLATGRVRLVSIELVFDQGIGYHRALDLALLSQGIERGHGDVVTVDLKELTQFLTGIAAAKAVGAKHPIGARDIRPDLLGIQFHVI